MPEISIIMGSYNCHDKYRVERSVDSLLNQSFSDWELIICDDGSKKDSLDILADVAQKDSRIRLVGYETNHGLAYALNYCMTFASGTYIARQDDDDRSLPDRLQRELLFLEQNPQYSFVGCSCLLVNQDGGFAGEKYLPESPVSDDFLWTSPYIHPTALFRADALRSVGGYRISKDTMRGQDYDLFMRMHGEGLIGANLQECLYEYTLPETGKSYRPMKYRIGEARIRQKGFSAMHVGIKGFPYIIKPLLIGALPNCIYNKIHRW